MDSKLFTLFLLGMGAGLDTIGDVLLKKWAIANEPKLLIIGLGIYILGSLFWVYSLRFEGLAKAIAIFVLLNLILIVGVGVFYFNEKVSMLNTIGIGLSVVSIVLIEFG